MFAGAEKTYIGIRANASGHFPYLEIFQSYAREILKRSYRNLPPWLEEGYSTVYGNLTFTDRGVRLGKARSRRSERPVREPAPAARSGPACGPHFALLQPRK